VGAPQGWGDVRSASGPLSKLRCDSIQPFPHPLRSRWPMVWCWHPGINGLPRSGLDWCDAFREG